MKSKPAKSALSPLRMWSLASRCTAQVEPVWWCMRWMTQLMSVAVCYGLPPHSGQPWAGALVLQPVLVRTANPKDAQRRLEKLIYIYEAVRKPSVGNSILIQ